MANIPFNPKNPESICWGCDRHCPADDLSCGNGSIRTPHPVELLGDVVEMLRGAGASGARTDENGAA